MKSPYVSEVQPNQVITSIFLVTGKDIRQKRTGEPYLSLLLSDRTGELDAKMWDNVEEVMETFSRDDFVRVRGLVQVHQNRLQLTVQKLQKVEEDAVEFADFFPASQRNPEEMWAELRGLVASMSDPPLRALGQAIVEDAELAKLYKTAPAAKTMHHAYLGGLLEHVLSMAQLGIVLARHYKLNPDLLLVGILLHDIGKIYELSYDRSFGYTVEGHLLGHMFLGSRLLDEKVRALPDFPPRLHMLLDHMILSHHGQLEFGSPKVPLFPEALLLHHLDNLDSKMEAMRYSLEKDRSVDGYFTGYSPALERQVLRKERFLRNDPAPSQAGGPPAGAPGAASAPSPPAPLPPARRTPALSSFAEQLQKALKP